MIFSLAQDFHDAVPAMPREHPKHRMLELLRNAERGIRNSDSRMRG